MFSSTRGRRVVRWIVLGTAAIGLSVATQAPASATVTVSDIAVGNAVCAQGTDALVITGTVTGTGTGKVVKTVTAKQVGGTAQGTDGITLDNRPGGNYGQDNFTITMPSGFNGRVKVTVGNKSLVIGANCSNGPLNITLIPNCSTSSQSGSAYGSVSTDDNTTVFGYVFAVPPSGQSQQSMERLSVAPGETGSWLSSFLPGTDAGTGPYLAEVSVGEMGAVATVPNVTC